MSKRGSGWHWTAGSMVFAGSLVVGQGMGPSVGLAQVIPDNTLPTSSVVNPTGTVFEIEAGSVQGDNLFHSFEVFSLPEGNTAFFNNDGSIQRIITRVTGGDRSLIDGLIRANGSADLFLINPNGVTFGPNASLNIGGSLMTSTADQLEFADGSIFSAVDPGSTPPLLTVSVPVGLQYGATPGDIVVQGTGHQLNFDGLDSIDRSQRPDGLQVNSGETLALAGSGVSLEGGNLTASQGRIELGSVGANEFVSLSASDTGWELDYGDVAQFENLRLSSAASVDVSGIGGGEVQVQGQAVRLTGGSTILANTQGEGTGGQVTLVGSERIVVTGFAETLIEGEPFPSFPSLILVGLDPGATGRGGDLRVQAPILRVADGGAIATNNLGNGLAGDMAVAASQRLVVSGGIPVEDVAFSSGILADVYSTGNGGNISIDAGSLSVLFGGEVSAATFSEGNTGDLAIVADNVEVVAGAQFLGASAILTSAETDISGDVGDLTIETGQLTVSGGAVVFSSTFGPEDGGDLRVFARGIAISGRSPGGNPSGLFSETLESDGNAGDLAIETETLTVSEGGEISSSTFNEGNAGIVTIRAQDISLNGIDTAVTAIFGAVQEDATGNGGAVFIEAQTLEVLGGAQIVAGSLGEGDAGLMTIDVADIRLSGSNVLGRSGLFASALEGAGAGGDLVVRGDRLSVTDGAVISASNFPSDGDLNRVGQGPAGNIQIAVDNILIEDGGQITASTSTGGNGNILIQADSLNMRRGSLIATNSQGDEPGGNIGISTAFLSGLGNSDITANAEESFGGRIVINSDLIIGLEFREELTPQNDVTATSELGEEFNGTVEINDPDAELYPGDLPEPEAVDTDQVVVACEQQFGNEFVVVGRGGLAADPSQRLQNQVLWQDWRLAEGLGEAAGDAVGDTVGSDRPPTPTLSASPFDQSPAVQPDHSNETEPHSVPVEATGWVKSGSGAIQLVGPEFLTSTANNFPNSNRVISDHSRFNDSSPAITCQDLRPQP